MEQLTRHHFGAQKTAYARLVALAAARMADVGLPTGRLTAATLGHHLAVADVADQLLAEHSGSHWITERELRHHAMETVRGRGDARPLDGVPHVPDAVLVDAGWRRMVVEVEISTRCGYAHEHTLRWYAGQLEYDQVRWFVGSAALSHRLAEPVARLRLDDLVAVERPIQAAKGALMAIPSPVALAAASVVLAAAPGRAPQRVPWRASYVRRRVRTLPHDPPPGAHGGRRLVRLRPR